MALGYGFMLGSDQIRGEKFLAIMARTLNIPVPKRTGI
jgi:hypothetical protein